MTLAIRLEKLGFLAADMQLAFRMSQFAPSDSDARMLVRHVVIQAESFIEHARALRKPLIAAGFRTTEFHRTKESYAAFFAEYFRVARDRLGAHVQDLDFGRRIELWNDIEASKSAFFADGAVEIYQSLGRLVIPGYVPFADFPELSDATFKEALQEYSASGSDVLEVELGSDPLAATRPNTVAMFNFTPVHSRAGQIALIHRWIKAEVELMRRFEAHTNAMRMLRARVITDVVSCCDCLITRSLPVGAPQQMDGLDRLLDASAVTPNPIDAFSASFDVKGSVRPIRHIRDKAGAHFELDPTFTLADFKHLLDDADLDDVLSFYDALRNAFEKACRQVLFLRGYLADGQALYGTTGVAGDKTVPYGSAGGEGRKVPVPDRLADTDEAYAAKLEAWLDGRADDRGRVRSLFWNAFLNSEVEEEYTTAEKLGGGGVRYHTHHLRRVHRVILEQLLKEEAPERVIGTLDLVAQCCNGDPDALGQVLLRFARSPRSSPYLAPIAGCFGELARWSNEEAKSFLLSSFRAQDPLLAIGSRVALLKIFVRSEGLTRLNNSLRLVHAFSEMDLLTDGLRPDARLLMLIVLASQFCDQRVAAFAGPFEADYAAMRAEISQLVGALAPADEARRVADLAGRLAETHDFAGISLLLFDELRGGPHEAVGHDLVRLACGGVVVTSSHDQARKHLCGCYLRLERKEEAFEIADRLARGSPEDNDFQVLRLQVMASLPGRADEARRLASRLRRQYVLNDEQAGLVAGVEAALAEAG